jgi:hypothetical protein
MGNFISYKDAPVFANFVSESRDVGTSTSIHLFAATQATINLNPNLAPNRYLGKTQSRNDFSVNGPLEAKLSITFFPLIETYGQFDLNIQRENQLAFFATTGNFAVGHAIQIGSYFFHRSYLQNYSVKINAFQPISITANFVAYDMESIINNEFVAVSNTAYLPIAKDGSKPYYKGLHALTTTMTTAAGILPDTKTSVQVNVDCQRTPVYNLGSRIPSSVVLTSVERTTTVEGENIGRAINLSGSSPGSTNIYFQPLDNSQTASEQAHMLKFDINGRIISQDLNIPQNGIINGKVVIKEIIL